MDYDLISKMSLEELKKVLKVSDSWLEDQLEKKRGSGKSICSK